jgi:hypothetical protein
MAPILVVPTPANASAYATDTHSWFTWTLFATFCLLGLLSVFLIAHWIAPKAKQTFFALIQRTRDEEMVLPTHLNPQARRDIVMPLPPSPTVINKEADGEKVDPSFDQVSMHESHI